MADEISETVWLATGRLRAKLDEHFPSDRAKALGRLTVEVYDIIRDWKIIHTAAEIKPMLSQLLQTVEKQMQALSDEAAAAFAGGRIKTSGQLLQKSAVLAGVASTIRRQIDGIEV